MVADGGSFGSQQLREADMRVGVMTSAAFRGTVLESGGVQAARRFPRGGAGRAPRRAGWDRKGAAAGRFAGGGKTDLREGGRHLLLLLGRACVRLVSGL